jgi:ribosomal protein L11 methyltransferase
VPAWSVMVSVAHAGEAELVADLLWSLGATAVADNGEVLVAGFADLSRAQGAADALTNDGLAATAQPDDGSWRSVWRDFAPDVAVGGVVVRTVRHGSAGVRLGRGPESPGLVIDIDPGDSFGSGHHPSTRQCLAAVVDRAGPGISMLDVGTGSGILAVTAALLGAAPAFAIDIDLAAARAAQTNASANRAPVLVAAAPIHAIRARFDLVVVNLGGARAPLELADLLTAALAPGATLVIGGLLAEQAGPVAGAFGPLGPVRTDLDAGWACLSVTGPS